MTTGSPTRTIIPATPGWYVAVFRDGGGKWENGISLSPIIAWDIERQAATTQAWSDSPVKPFVRHHVQPILSDGTNPEHFRVWGIKRPDGKYEIGDTTCEMESDAIEELKALREPAVRTVCEQ